MNWQAVIESLREDVKALQRAQLNVPAGQIAATAMLGTSGVVLAKLADALQMGLNKKSEGN